MKRIVRTTKELISRGRNSHESQQAEADPAHYLGGKWLSGGGNSSFAELKQECRTISLRLAMSFRALSCQIHERCDGDCGSDVVYHENPMIDPEDLGSSIVFAGMVGVDPPKAPTQDVPRDAQWLEQQKPSKLVYSRINGLEGEIRLLRVKEALFRADVVECELITTSLDRCEDFLALSYCWGSDKQNELMLCNGQSHHISTSFNAALKTFRESAKTRGRLLWCDAVSIDQDNLAERNEQLPVIRRIYSEADACFVHLGEGEQLVTQGLDLMLRLDHLQKYQNTPEKHGSIPTNALLTLLPSRGHTCWAEYLRVFTSPWFAHTWTLQESALSKKALLGIGRYVVAWDCLEGSFNFLRRHDLLLRIGPRPEGAMRHILNFPRIQEIRSISQSPNPSSALIAALRAARDFKVADPRDKLFAILGLIGDLPDELKTIVDYRLSAGEVFHRVALYMCKSRRPVDLLAHAGLQRQSGQWDMPSWVPDWYSDNIDRNERPLLLLRPEVFLAAGRQNTSRIQAGSAASPLRVLFTLGLCHHRITQASNPYADTKSMSEAVYAWLDSTRRCIESSGSLVYDDVEEAVARTLLIDDLCSDENAITQTTPITNPKTTFQAAKAEIDKAKRSKDPEDAFFGLFTNGKNNPLQTFIMQMTVAVVGRRFAITDGGYTGLPTVTQLFNFDPFEPIVWRLKWFSLGFK